MTTTERDETVLRGLLLHAAQDAWQGPDLAAVARRGERHARTRRTARLAAGGLLAAGSAFVVARTGSPSPAGPDAAATGGSVGGALPAAPVSVLVILLVAAATVSVGRLALRLARRLGRMPTRPARAVLVAVLAIAFLTISSQVALRSVAVPSAAMEPTLAVGSHAVVAVRVPGLTQVRRGDVVVVRAPASWLPEGGLLVKRVVGLPGERIACCDAQGRVTVEGRPLDEPYLRAGETPSERTFSVVVRPGTLFLLGDARSISEDSRVHPSEGIRLSDVVGIVVAQAP